MSFQKNKMKANLLQTNEKTKLMQGSFMVKGSITNSEVYIVFHYPVFVFAIFPSAGTATYIKQAGWGERCFLSKGL